MSAIEGVSEIFDPAQWDDVPGFDAASTKWLWQHGALGVGADTFGPDATMDQDFSSTSEITGSRFCSAASARDFVHMPWAMLVGKPNALAVSG